MSQNGSNGNGSSTHVDVDVVVAGAGFGGMYLLHRLRGLGFSARVFETGHDVGGTWYWNRYPGARVDIQSVEYSFSFDPQLEKDWKWSEKYSPQPELLKYAQHVAERYDLRRDIQFETKVVSAVWDDDARVWHLRTSQGDDVTARYYVMATGTLSVPKEIDIEGTDRFKGEVYLTSRWPHQGVDFTGKNVAVIGTGSSAIQSIPEIAKQASRLTVFQRTPNFSIPANNGPIPDDVMAQYQRDRDSFRKMERESAAGVAVEPSLVSALAVSDEERLATYEKGWERGGIVEFLNTYMDHMTNIKANDLLSEFVRNKIRSTVKDPETAEALCPKSYPIGTKRLCVDTGYYATYNLPHVRLVDIRKHPIKSVTEKGLDLVDESFEFDAIVFATGFDAMTGAMVNVDITGRDGLSLKDAWQYGPTTYLGLTVAGFPNLFMITGPGSPSVLSNMIVSIEQHVDWIVDCLVDQREGGYEAIEPTGTAVDGWVQHVNDYADISLMPLANSWYMGANVPGKAACFLPFAGGVGTYRIICDEVRAKNYLGFARRGAAGESCNDGIVRRLQADVGVMVDMMATLGLPPMETMSPVDARAFVEAMAATRAPGPDVGEVVDGTLPGAAGDLIYRLYRPSNAGPHPILVYFHGGGWVFGSHESDDPFCRDLCARTDAVVISVNYRHAPEDRFPAAADDAIAAVNWVAAHAGDFGGNGQLAVGGWSAGANLAAVVCQAARDAGGPAIAGQLLVTPVTNAPNTTASYVDNGDGYILTAPLMNWFWDHYADEADRANPKASPLRAKDLSGLPPALVVTAEFDPLRDEGAAYAAALAAAAGVDATHLPCRGHIHTSPTMVDVLPSGAPVRAEMAVAIRRFFGTTVN